MSGAEMKIFEDYTQLYCKTEHGKQMFLSENEIRASIIFKVKILHCFLLPDNNFLLSRASRTGRQCCTHFGL